MEERTAEDKVIESIIIEDKQRLYDDQDFMPIRQSLYIVHNQIPEWDLDNLNRAVWKRPTQIVEKPSYFGGTPLAVKIGSLPDLNFMSALMACSVYPKIDLLENIFASRPEDFSMYGIYTCRFFVNGEWKDIITDTQIPCIRNEKTNDITPGYSYSPNINEYWMCLAEKAYAKALGSYEAISKIRISEALLHLTGGTVQQIYIRGKGKAKQEGGYITSISSTFAEYMNNDSMILVMPDSKENIDIDADGSVDNDDEQMLTAESIMSEQFNFLTDRYYSVVALRDVHGFDLILLHNPWADQPDCWKGEWSTMSGEWDTYPDILEEFENDPTLPWTRKKPNNYFWMPTKQFMKYFNSVYICKLFPNNSYSYFRIPGAWTKVTACGPPTTIRDRDLVAKEAAASRVTAFQKATAAMVIDGDSSWFNNPQYRVTCETPTNIYISLVPIYSNEDNQQMFSLNVTSIPRPSTFPSHLWDYSITDIVEKDKSDSGGKVKGQEASIWNFELKPERFYHIVPHTMKRGHEGKFCLRIYSSGPITVEKVDDLLVHVKKGEWRKSADIDTTGGRPFESKDNKVKENTKWCQNPQYHLEVADPFSNAEIHLKIVVRKTNKEKIGKAGAADADVNIGIIVCKADCLEDNDQRARKKKPRQNPMGELLPNKESSLKKKPIVTEEAAPTKGETGKTVLRKVAITPDTYYAQTSFSHKNEATIYFPKIPRAWMPNGLIIVPCLSDKNVKGNYDLEIYASETVLLNQLPDPYSRTIAGEWVESTAGGSHLSTTWKKNPRYALKIKSNKGGAPARVRITLTRHGSTWKTMCKKDTLGCMIGFYIFIQKGDTSTQVFDSGFIPDDEVSTATSFTLEQLSSDSEYVIMPSTFLEGKVGSFVLSVIAEYEFQLSKL